LLRQVLLVDEYPEQRHVLIHRLSEAYAVLKANSADAAVALLAIASIDLMTSNRRMPGTTDGAGSAARLRTSRSPSPRWL